MIVEILKKFTGITEDIELLKLELIDLNGNLTEKGKLLVKQYYEGGHEGLKNA